MKTIASHDRGFTLVELIVVIVVIGIVATYATMRNGSAATFTLPSQADSLARDLRHVQALATTWNRSLRVSTTAGANGSWSVSCVNAGASPCNASPVVDPATGAAFSASVQKGLVLAGPTTFDVDSQGRPAASGTWTVSIEGSTKTVAVASPTGYVSVTP